ncbi:MAG: hypothetical protein JO209_02810 [Acidisphaera sp.]|nr:hypothetical protein [Acidisphaera sp.]
MPLNVFYAWQGGSDGALCRTLIRDALERAGRELGRELALHEPGRDALARLPAQAAAGRGFSAAIANRIREADLFLADLTLAGPGRAPDPNVLFEYGYALHALGEQRTIAVMNDAFGGPDQLPADLQLRRPPIAYTAADASAKEAAARARQQAGVMLAGRLQMALKAVVTQFPEVGGGDALAHQPMETADGFGSLVAPGGFLCIRHNLLRSTERRVVRLRTGPYLYLRLVPRFVQRELSYAEAQRIAMSRLPPLSATRVAALPALGRNEDGVVSFAPAEGDADVAESAVALFLSREIWGIDFRFLRRDLPGRAHGLNTPYVPTGAVEEILLDGFIDFVEAARGPLGLTLPLRVEAGLHGIRDYTLAIRKDRYAEPFAGHIFKDHIVHKTTLERWDADPFAVLRPLFDAIYDAGGLERPDERVAGKRQR